MTQQVEHKPKLFHLTLEGEDIGVSEELRAVAADFARHMADEYDTRRGYYHNLLKRYPDDEGLKQLYTPETIEALASRADTPEAVKRLRRTVFHQVSWDELMAAHEEDPEQAMLCLKAIYDRAEGYVRGGLLASHALDLSQPFEKGQFSYIRAAFYEEWQPRGGIEASLIDTLAQCYVAWQYWLTRAF